MNTTITLDITAEVSARTVEHDYGVPRSPVWHELEDVTVDTVHMFDRSWTRDEFKEEFGNLVEWIEEGVTMEDFD